MATKNEPKRIPAGGTVLGIGLACPDIVFCLVRADNGQAKLASFDLGGRRLCGLDPHGPMRQPSWGFPWHMRVAEDESAWLGCGSRLRQVGAGGTELGRLELEVEPGEHLGSFLLLTDGFIVSLYRPDSADILNPRVVRLDPAGRPRWSTMLPVGAIAYEGVVEMGVETDWQVRPMPAWQPKDWQPARGSEPMLLAADRLLVNYAEMRSGIGYSYCLDSTTGRLLWTTEPGPDGTVAIAGANAFFIGTQGYGAFAMRWYAGDGTVRQHWPCHGHVLFTQEGEFRVVEMENCLPSRMHFSVLLSDGSVRKGPHLDGYYTTYPAISREGVAAFWRNGKLWAVDRHLAKRTLWEDEALAEKGIMTRMLLADNGTLAFGVESELWMVPTGLGPLADSPWPCGGGNARGNPLYLAG